MTQRIPENLSAAEWRLVTIIRNTFALPLAGAERFSCQSLQSVS